MMKKKRKPYKHGLFQPLGQVTRPRVGTNAASYYMDKQPRTLREWACYQNGPIRPIKVFGKWLWSVAEIRDLLGGDHA